MAKKKVYAVKKGKQTGLFYSWNECKESVSGYPGAEYKGFETEEEAKNYLENRIQEIKKVDIGIFAMTRQQALGNIFMLGMNGAKLYMNRDGQNYKYLTEKLNCSISYIDEINQMDFNSFISISESARMNNYEQILKINETDYKMKKWNDFFEA